MAEQVCAECENPRDDSTSVCAACGAPPQREQRDDESLMGGVRAADLEPYTALRYIARLFKVLAVLMIIMLIGEVVMGVMTAGASAITTLIVEATRLIVLAGLLWAAGDLALLLIDMGHDVRVSRILLWRMNAEMHRQADEEAKASPQERRTTPR